jgi:hypothetical protein
MDLVVLHQAIDQESVLSLVPPSRFSARGRMRRLNQPFRAPFVDPCGDTTKACEQLLADGTSLPALGFVTKLPSRAYGRW